MPESKSESMPESKSPASKSLSLEVGGKDWRELRKKCLVPIPGRYSALYFFNAKVLGHESVVPMTYRAHYAPCLFAEGATGIPRIDEARVKMMLIPRGMGKSTLFTKGLTLQKLMAHDDHAVAIANEVSPNAEAFLAMVKQELEGNLFLRALFPERVYENPLKEAPEWRQDRIVIPRKKPNPTSPSVLAAGTNRTVTGVHMNCWVLDDLLSQNAAEAAFKGNFGEIESVNRWVSRLQPLLKSPKRDPIYVIGTRWWEGDTYEFIEEFFGHGEPREEYVWNLRLPDGERQSILVYRVGEIAVFSRPAIVDGASIFPERYDLEELQRMQQEDPVFFAGQYMLKPAGGAASEFKPDWMRYYELDGAQLRFRDQSGRLQYTSVRDLVCFMSVDLAISDSHSAARSACPIAGTNGREVFLLEDYAEKGLGMFDLAQKVVDFYVRYRPRRIFIETIAYQAAFIEALAQAARERGVPDLMSHVEEIKSHGKQRKDMRIYGLEPFFKRGLFYAHKSHTNFLQEYASFPRGALRDVLDSLSFQKDEWERMAQSHGGARSVDGKSLQKRLNEAQLSRLRASVGRGGGY
jgi:phage terminase large subunit-like protein